MEKISIPPIYEEEIIELVFQDAQIYFKYRNKDEIIELIFKEVYQFDFCEFDYVMEHNWQFGLYKIQKSSKIDALISGFSEEKLSRVFGGELGKISHYKLTVDDVGIYNFICKDFDIKIMRG